MAHDPLDPASLISHVKDATYFQVPRALTRADTTDPSATPGIVEIPQFYTGQPIIESQNQFVEPFDLQVTKFMVLEVVAARSCWSGWASSWPRSWPPDARPKGRFWNAIEAFLLFIRDEVARPAIGHARRRPLPALLVDDFLLRADLQPVGNGPVDGVAHRVRLAVTGTLALMTFGAVVVAGSKKLGPIGFWKAQVPHMDLPFAIAILLKPMLFVIEVVGLLIKHFVLSVRLLANMFAGHLVLGVLVGFVAVVGAQASSYLSPLFLGVSVASILGSVAMSLLELFVAFLQAYIFTFLSALFIGMAVHPH